MATKKRRHGTVEAPSLNELLSPDSNPTVKKPRLEKSISPCKWSVDDVTEHLSRRGFSDSIITAFRNYEISGDLFLSITIDQLGVMGLQAREQNEVQSVVKQLNRMSIVGMEKVFNDPIHGHIELHPLMVRIIDTPQFQRLRNIKQLGAAYYVFMGASHNRFEHSIGVGYLAGELVSMLQNKQPTLNITEQDLLCVKIAGLCHDLGHGPFSHMFDGMFIPRILPDKRWKHEMASVMMFDHLVESNGLKDEFKRYGLSEKDFSFIKEQIAGPKESELSSQASDWPYSGRPKEKSFLYEVVANKRNGIDVDKWDYFARDCHCLGIPNNFDLKRFMAFARIIEVNDRWQICTRDKEVGNLYEMFHTRLSLHRRAYQHKTSNIIEYMITEALVKADPHLKLQGSDGLMVRMSEAIEDPVAYTKLTDHIVYSIMESTDPNLTEAKEILESIECRKLYKCVGQTAPPSGTYYNKSDSRKLAEAIISSSEDMEGLSSLTADDLVIDVVTFDYGMGEKNPIDQMSFYSKHNPDKAIKVRKDQVSEMLPHKFKEQSIRVYCKLLDENSLKLAETYFINWCRKQSDFPLEDCGLPFTPYSSPYTKQQKHVVRAEQDPDQTPTNNSRRQLNFKP